MSKALSAKKLNTPILRSATSKVLKENPNKLNKKAATCSKSVNYEKRINDPVQTMVELDDATSSSSIMEFLKQEQNCYGNNDLGSVQNMSSESDVDVETIFQEINRLTDNSDTRTVDELLHEAELLLKCSHMVSPSLKSPIKRSQKNMSNNVQLNKKYTKSIENIKTPNLKAKSKKTGQEDVSSFRKSKASPSSSPDLDKSTPVISNESFFRGGILDSIVSQENFKEKLSDNDTSNHNINENANTSVNNTSKDISVLHLLSSDTEDGTDTIEEITEGMETIELEIVHDDEESRESNGKLFNNTMTSVFSSMSSCPSGRTTILQQSKQLNQYSTNVQSMCEFNVGRRSSGDGDAIAATFDTPPQVRDSINNLLGSPLRRLTPVERRSSNYMIRRSSMTTPDSGISSQVIIPTTSTQSLSSSPLHKSVAVGTPLRIYCDKSVNSSSRQLVSTLTSPINSNTALVSATREHTLKQEIEKLQERLKDTEERLESFRIQHDTLSQLHRTLRESNTTLQEQSEILKLDVQHLTECANVLRSELQSARNDREEAIELQKMLQTELDETRNEKKRAQEQKDKDGKTIQDLQRQCREMERILIRKHPDSVSALIVASKNTNEENVGSRKLLEQRIAQLEADAKEQDCKAQKILANVQARFNSVQSKYETHIADLETQVLSLQEINTKLNEKIESQVRTLDYFVSQKAERYYNNCTQTDEYSITNTASCTHLKTAQLKMCNHNNDSTNNKPNKKIIHKTFGTQTVCCTKESSTNTIGTWHQQSANSSASSTANSTPNNSRPNSKQSALRKPQVTGSTLISVASLKLPVSQSGPTNVDDKRTASMPTTNASATIKADTHLVATIRSMRIDLAIKNKAMQRLTRELDECKKTIKKLQKERDDVKCDKTQYSTASSKNQYNSRIPATTEMQALKEAQSRYKLLETDYKTLREKRLQDLKTLQTAHERELTSCHETVRLLQQRLNERDEQFVMQKRRKLPVDYYALKAKVTSLERRHTEREERLHMLVEALSKGRLNNALEELLGDNNNQ